MVGPKRTYCMYISFAGAIFFFFIAICSCIGMEALKLPEGKHVERGLQVLLTAIIYGAIGGYIYYRKYMADGENSQYLENQQNEGLRSRLVQNY